MARQAILSAEKLYVEDDYRGAANRSYYASYHAATAVSIEHGDANLFPNGWNNPSHDQLPGLIRTNGDLDLTVRRAIVRHLVALRDTREDADYRPGRTVDKDTVLNRFQRAERVLQMLNIGE